ncbi:uncharacterized protein LACBIDRAFT_191523 [Laccaria bicolor S238N-H82]|uniref:Predicted protein n=1 Tax=Laccaria bicolor (strain S238N-H82 / ATCC MYA-4686) TaxID=486041 RepID=B0DPU2_LACBS|nr:uncharacterized protein LACBIDRAFT_191523 [Laccaria bicolor S238N-H82]EDR03514.1 predicted protein [Laccaria bicolor S238N-H82]|eukprot:XP_001885970.1 predicted protein [Laccaria bicolor S238N-H82]
MASTKVEYQTVTFKQLIYNDSGSGADTDLATWRPDLSEGWYYLGPAATNNSNTPGTGIVVRELEPGVLVDVADWTQVWNDTGSHNKTDFALWRGVGPTLDYVVVGGFFTRSHNKPTTDEAKGIKAIHKSALHSTGPGSQIWTDKGSKAKEDGAIWGISTIDVVPTGAFVPVAGYNNPPQELYGLQFVEVEGGGLEGEH